MTEAILKEKPPPIPLNEMEFPPEKAYRSLHLSKAGGTDNLRGYTKK